MAECYRISRGCTSLRHFECSEAIQRIGHLYPPVEITTEIAANRTTPRRKAADGASVDIGTHCRSRIPAFSHVKVPLVSKISFSQTLRTTRHTYSQLSTVPSHFIIQQAHRKMQTFGPTGLSKRLTSLPGFENAHMLPPITFGERRKL